MLTMMRLNKEGYDILKQELTKQEGPFSRTNNVMLALDLLEKGEDLSSGMVTKNHLINIIKVLCTQLQWTEEKEEQNTNTEEILSQNNDKIEEDTTNTQNTGMSKKSQEICKFYKSGKCQYGRTGKKLISGKMCAFSHPNICKKFENYGYKENGCKNKKCDNLHMNLCKMFMKTQSCKYEDKCKYHHPKKLKNVYQNNPETQSTQQHNGYKSSYAQIVTKNVHSKNDFLGHHPANHPYLGQAVQVQQPFLEQNSKVQQPIMEPQGNQSQILELLMSLNQRMTNLEKQRL